MMRLPDELQQLVLVAKLLNRMENYRVVLIPLASKKEIGCGGQYCTEILKIASPDDQHTEISLTKVNEKAIEREYKCSKGHITKLYWYYETPTEA